MATLSVIIPAYNAAADLADAIESVLAQSYRDCEIIVVDDGSTDDTEAVAGHYRGSVAYVKLPHGGVSRARNRGIQMSRGKYVAFLDADDLWLPEKLALQVPVLEADPEVGIVCGDFSVSGRGDCGSYLAGCRHARSGRVFDEIIQEYFILTSTAVLRRSCLDEAGLFDETLQGSEDRHLWLRIGYRWKVQVLPDLLVKKRNRPGNISSNLLSATETRIRMWSSLFNILPGLPAHSRALIHNELSKNYFDLGYHWFTEMRSLEARKNLALAAKHDWSNGKAYAYLAASYLPVPVVKMVRSFKHALS